MRQGYGRQLSRIFLLGTALLLTSTFSGCGYKNAPIPPSSVVPKTITDLTYSTDTKGVQLDWSYPVKTIRDTPLDNISSFELYRAEVLLEDYCNTCPIPFGKPMVLDGGAPFDGEMRQKASYQSDLLRPGYKYFFKVRSRTSWWADSADSNIVTFVWFQPAAAPAGLTLTPGDRQVKISWQPVTVLSDGSALQMPVKYQVLRGVDGRGLAPLGGPIAATSLVDRQVENGVGYSYAVRSMMLLQDELVGGETCKTQKISPVDQTPPPAPTGVTVVETEVGVKVFWERSEADDLGGYKVYRRVVGSKGVELIGQVAPEYTIFVDKKAQGGEGYRYAVSAVDKAKPANESKKSKEAAARY